jgi:hypothetical protein
MRNARRLAQFQVSCTSDAIVIENRGPESWALEIGNLRVSAISEFGAEGYLIGPREPQRAGLQPGERGKVRPAMADWLARSCHFASPSPPKAADIFGRAADELQGPAPRPLYCEFAFAFTARDTATDQRLEASGWCTPSTSTHAESAGRLELAR